MVEIHKRVEIVKLDNRNRITIPKKFVKLLNLNRGDKFITFLFYGSGISGILLINLKDIFNRGEVFDFINFLSSGNVYICKKKNIAINEKILTIKKLRELDMFCPECDMFDSCIIGKRIW